jgi:Ni/Fe-hydrogenase subunit HybB-like protein
VINKLQRDLCAIYSYKRASVAVDMYWLVPNVAASIFFNFLIVLVQNQLEFVSYICLLREDLTNAYCFYADRVQRVMK